MDANLIRSRCQYRTMWLSGSRGVAFQGCVHSGLSVAFRSFSFEAAYRFKPHLARRVEGSELIRTSQTA